MAHYVKCYHQTHKKCSDLWILLWEQFQEFSSHKNGACFSALYPMWHCNSRSFFSTKAALSPEYVREDQASYCQVLLSLKLMWLKLIKSRDTTFISINQTEKLMQSCSWEVAAQIKYLAIFQVITKTLNPICRSLSKTATGSSNHVSVWWSLQHKDTKHVNLRIDVCLHSLWSVVLTSSL